MVTCTICKKSFKNTQGLHGHTFFAHANDGDPCFEPVAQRAEESSGFSLAPVSTEHRLRSLEQRLAMLEQSTGALQREEPDEAPSSSRKPLAEQVAELAEGLKTLTSSTISYTAQLTEQLSTLASSRISHTELTPVVEQLEALTRRLNSIDSLHKSVVVALGNYENQLNTKVDREMVSQLQARISGLEKWKAELEKLLVTVQKAQLV